MSLLLLLALLMRDSTARLMGGTEASRPATKLTEGEMLVTREKGYGFELDIRICSRLVTGVGFCSRVGSRAEIWFMSASRSGSWIDSASVCRQLARIAGPDM